MYIKVVRTVTREDSYSLSTEVRFTNTVNMYWKWIWKTKLKTVLLTSLYPINTLPSDPIPDWHLRKSTKLRRSIPIISDFVKCRRKYSTKMSDNFLLELFVFMFILLSISKGVLNDITTQKTIKIVLSKVIPTTNDTVDLLQIFT